MAPDDHVVSADPEPPIARQPYLRPQLVVHGPIQNLTRATADGQASILPDDN